MQPKKSPTPFDLDMVYAIIAIIFLVAILLSTSCVSVTDGGDEPLWKPHVYLFSPDPSGRCAFIDGKGHVLDCDEPLIHDFYLAPMSDLVTLKSKLNQCNDWR